MKEAIGGVSIFQIVIVFVLLFAGIMCLTINHSRAFAVKDEIINVIETKGLDDKAIEDIVAKLDEAGYRVTGSCPDSSWTGYDRRGEKKAPYTFCIKQNNVAASFRNNAEQVCRSARGTCTVADSVLYPKMIYYDVVLFYQLDIPLFTQAFNFTLKGSTKVVVG